MQRVILVDDEDELRQSLTRALRRRFPSLDIVPACNAAEAMSSMGAELQLLVTDVRMPGRCGIELIVATRELHPSARVLVITAYASEHPPSEPCASVAYLEKPFELPTFFETVERLLACPAPSAQSLVGIAKLCCLGRYTGVVGVARGDDRGSAWFELGRPMHARAGILEGPAAFATLMGWTGARFELREELTSFTSIPSSSSALVVDGSCCRYKEK